MTMTHRDNLCVQNGALAIGTTTQKAKTVNAITYTINGRVYNKAATDDLFTLAGTTLTATASLIDGTATAGGSATANGVTLTATASLINGAATASSTAAGTTLAATASLIAGAASASSQASGVINTVTASLLAGGVAADSVGAGTIQTIAASLIAGTASASSPDATAPGAVVRADVFLIAGQAYGNSWQSDAGNRRIKAQRERAAIRNRNMVVQLVTLISSGVLDE